jgi:hypothetical protein
MKMKPGLGHELSQRSLFVKRASKLCKKGSVHRSNTSSCSPVWIPVLAVPASLWPTSRFRNPRLREPACACLGSRQSAHSGFCLEIKQAGDRWQRHLPRKPTRTSMEAFCRPQVHVPSAAARNDSLQYGFLTTRWRRDGHTLDT